jgi:CubicO group peptidase (beta-lactamase class C family)
MSREFREMTKIRGECQPGYGAVRDALAENFERHGEVGAACCVYHRGEPVVDLWGGFADAAGKRPWQRDTLQLVFSATKGVTAICANLLAQRGELDVDAPIARYWPEFAAAGKGEIPVRFALCHKAGLAAVEGDLELDEVLAWDPVVAAIAAQEPNWEPGSAHGYHLRSFGWIVGEIVRRITGRSIGRFFREEVAEALALDFWIGLPEVELMRCAELIPDEAGASRLAEVLGADSLAGRALQGPSDLFAYDEMWNRPEILKAEMPSSNGVGDARSLARLYAATVGEVDGVRILDDDVVERAIQVQSDGRDKVIMLPTRFGLGFSLPPMLAQGCGERAFGHPGAGGSLAFADPENALSFAYVMNRMKLEAVVDERSATLVRATYDSL